MEMRGVNAYLRRCHQWVQQGLGGATARVAVALGNEAADLDSVVSAIGLGYVTSRDAGEAAPMLPVLNIPRADLPLRTEVTFVMKELGLDTSALLFTDSIDLAGLAKSDRLDLALVDHNLLSRAQSSLARSVRSIIDHHADERAYLETTVDERVIEPVGSASTLIARFARERQLLDAELARLLLPAVLLDTVNLDPALGRTTAADTDMVNAMTGVIGIAAPDAKAYTDALFSRAMTAKTSIDALSCRDLLRKDFKSWNFTPSVLLGISAVAYSPAQFFARHSDLPAQLESYAVENGLNVLMAMLYVDKPHFDRWIVVYFPSKQPVDATLVEYLEGAAVLNLAKEAHSACSERLRVYHQGNVKATRKTVQPLLDTFYRQES